MKITLKVEGADQIRKRLAEIDKRQQRIGLIKAAKAGSNPIAVEMAARAPYDPDSRHALSPATHHKHLNESIVTKFVRRGVNRVTQAIGPDSKHAWYARWQEFGTVKQTAKPFIRPSLEDQSDEAVDLAGKELWIVTIQGLPTK